VKENHQWILSSLRNSIEAGRRGWQPRRLALPQRSWGLNTAVAHRPIGQSSKKQASNLVEELSGIGYRARRRKPPCILVTTQSTDINPITKRQNMCNNRSSTVSNQSDSLCNQRYCELRKKDGIWICCICDFGWQKDSPNRYQYCLAGGCIHEVCPDCKSWESRKCRFYENCASTEEANVDEERRAEELSKNENEPTEK
jgi:hypothetical protein